MNEIQQQQVAEIIGDWYFKWKKQFPDVPHPLGFAKEDLKREICEWIEKQKFVEIEEGHDFDCEGTMCYCASREKRRKNGKI